MRRILPFSLSLLLVTPLSHAIGLFELEQYQLEHDRRLVMASQDVRIATARQEQREAESGWSLFANARGGRAEEAVTEQTGRVSNTYGYTVGASYPLLGSRTVQQKQVSEASRQVEAARLGAESLKQQALLQLRRAYLELWQAEEQLRLARAFLSERAVVIRVLALRREEGLLLASDEQTFLSAFAEAEAQAIGAEQSAAVARQRIAALTGVSVQRLQALIAPRLDVVLDQRPDGKEMQPEVRLARQEWEYQQQKVRSSGWDGVQSSLDFSFSDGREAWAPNVPSRQLQASINVRMPLEIGKLRRGVQEESLAALEKSRLNYDEVQERYALDVAAAVADYRGAQASLLTSSMELAAARQALYERTLRSQTLAGDELEKRLQARYGYYRMARQQLNGWSQWQQASTRLASLGFPLRQAVLPAPHNLSAPMENGKGSVPQAPLSGIAFAVPTGSYVWHSQAALQNPVAQIAKWRSYGLTRVLLGLDSRQIDDPTLASRVGNLVDLAHQSQIRIELLLGDAQWILPKGRRQLVDLLQRLKALPVDGVNLDLEVEQLPNWELRREELVSDWLESLAAAARTVPWPVGATFHHRHLAQPQLGARLRAAGVSNAAVMIFSTRQASVLEVADRAQGVLAGLPFALVQSVERQLPPSESYARRGLAPLVELSRQLQRHGQPDLLLQAWEDLQTFKP